jgi:hypothetical protein
MKKFNSSLPLAVALTGLLMASAGCQVLTNDNTGAGSQVNNANGCAAGNLAANATPSEPIAIGYSGTDVSSTAQSFVLSSTTAATVSVASVTLQLKAIAPLKDTVNSEITVSIQSSNGTGSSAQPSGVQLGATSNINTAMISTSAFTNYEFSLSPTATLVPNTLYWVVLTEDSPSSSYSNYIEWAGAATGSLPASIRTLTISDIAGVNDGWTTPTTFAGAAEMLFGVGCTGNL